MRLAPAFPADRCSAVLIEAGSPPTVVATSDVPGFRRPLDLARYPEIDQALRSRQPVVVADARVDPLFASVREEIVAVGVKSVMVVPLLAGGAVVGALFARTRNLAGAYDALALALGRAASAALAATASTYWRERGLDRKAAELEAAWAGKVRDLQESQRRLSDSGRYKEEAISIFAHDVRGPLNILWGHARLLAGGALPKQERGSVDAIQRQARKLLDLSEAMVEQGRGEATHFTLDPEEVDLAGVCRELVGEHEILGAERGVSLQLVAPEQLRLLADAPKVRQVIQNLLGHAIAHAREGGHVAVVVEALARPDGEMARVRVSDDGAGLSAEELSAVFERYRPRPGRANLGLYICRAFVELHGGRIWAESSPAGGCTFSFTLPAVDARLPGRALHPAPERPRVLLVEDEPDLAAIAAEILRTRYRVEIAQNGAEAVALTRELRPDVVLMDVFLPRLDGLDATAALKAAPDTRDIPIILVSAHQGVADKIRALHLGAVDYLAKPFDAQQLLSRVEAALGKRAGVTDQKREAVRGIDSATGLLDRSGFLRRVAQEASRARRYGQMLSLVGFVPSAPLDAVALGPAAAALKAGLRSGDVLGHLGQGRFVVCLPDATPQAAARVCERLAGGLVARVELEVVDGLAGTPEEQLALALREKAGLRK